MNSLNRAEIIGNITRDPELKTTKTEQAVTTIGVATNRAWTDSSGSKHDEAEYHNVVCWGKLAEIVCQYLKKGSKVYFAGRLRTRMWEDESAIKHYRTEIVAQDMIMLSPKGERGESFSANKNSETKKAETKKTETKDEKPKDAGESGFDDLPNGNGDVATEDLPF